MLEPVLRLIRTVRWLKPIQIFARAWLMLGRPRADLSPAPSVRSSAVRWEPCHRAQSQLGPDQLCFLGATRSVAGASDWNNCGWPKLWLYNAHYFDDLVAVQAKSRLEWHAGLIGRWVQENAPAHGVGWDPYPTSLRIVNWIKWAWIDGELTSSATHSLAIQVRFLRRRLEWHLLGNHLWANAKALAFAGVYFEGEEAASWLAEGMRLLDQQLEEQVLADGGHFERSPMYHAILLEDLLDLLQLAGRNPSLFGQPRLARWGQKARAMEHWLAQMTHPDGGIAFFNDATLGIAPDLRALREYARRLGLEQDGVDPGPIHALPESGYVRMQVGPAVLIADVGEIGPDYLPGHAHADSSSFELSIDGQRLFVNGGISTYEPGVERLRQRGTAAHNALQLEGKDSSEVWSSFRVGRRARPLDVHWQQDADRQVLHAAHDGYRWLPGRPVPHRRWTLSTIALRVEDTIEGAFALAASRFHLHPHWSIGVEGPSHGWIQGHRRIAWRLASAGAARIESGSWHPGFGQSVPLAVLVIETQEAKIDICFSWE